MHREIFLVVCGVCSLISEPLLAIDQQIIDMRTKQLTSMSKVDRDRLDRNIQAFKELSPDQLSQYRKLHEDILKDRKEAGGLSTLMETYSLWLHTLTPTQRDELQRETDPGKKLVIVRRIKEEQDHPVEGREPQHQDSQLRENQQRDSQQDEAFTQANPKVPPKFAFDKKDLDIVAKTLVDSFPADNRKPEYEQPSLETYLPIINQSLQLFGNDHEWPGEIALTKLITAIRKESAKEIQKSSSKRDAFIRMILLGILRLANESVQEPTEEEQIKTTLALKPEERDRIMNLPGRQMKGWIRKKFIESKGEDAKKQFAQLLIYRRQVIEMFDRLNVELPPFLKRPIPVRDRPRGKG